MHIAYKAKGTILSTKSTKDKISEYTFHWDPNIMVSNERNEFKNLFSLSLREALEVMQYEKLKAALKEDTDLLSTLELTPAHLPKLVNKNPALAVSVLVVLSCLLLWLGGVVVSRYRHRGTPQTYLWQ